MQHFRRYDVGQPSDKISAQPRNLPRKLTPFRQIRADQADELDPVLHYSSRFTIRQTEPGSLVKRRSQVRSLSRAQCSHQGKRSIGVHPVAHARVAAPKDLRRRERGIADPRRRFEEGSSALRITSEIATLRGSVQDVQRVTQGLIESSSGDLIEVADRLVVEVVEWDGDDVVAADDTGLGKSVLGAELDFRSNTSNGAGDRCTVDCGENLDCRVASQHTDRATTGRRTEIGPVNVVASYHAGVVSAVSRLAD